MNHRDIVDASVKWVKSSGFSVVAKEISSMCSERPDVIGFRSGNVSVLIEVKTSRSDFIRDLGKPFRSNPKLGIGMYRFYACEEGIVLPEELPEKWGLIYIIDGKCKMVAGPKGNAWTHEKNVQGWSEWQHERSIENEMKVLYSIARRKA